jgi:hypothetical protein
MARGMGKVQKTIKALVSKEFAATESILRQGRPLGWESTLRWGLVGTCLTLALFGIGLLMPTLAAAITALALAWVLLLLTLLVALRDVGIRKRVVLTATIPLVAGCGLFQIVRHPPQSEILVAIRGIPDAVYNRIAPSLKQQQTTQGQAPAIPATSHTVTYPKEGRTNPSMPSNRVSPRAPQRNDPRIQFTSSPLWTEQRKATVRMEIQTFDRYLSRNNVVKPPERIPLIRISEGTQVSWGFVTPVNPPFDQRQIPVPMGDFTPLRIRTLYANYVFDTILSVYDAPEHSSLVWASWIYSEYFAASSLNTAPGSNPKSMNGWVSALWDIRQDRGQDFTDRALMYSLKAPVEYSDDVNKYFSDRFRGGVLVVKNDFSEVVEVNKILARHGLLK